MTGIIPAPDRLVVASANPHKIAEVERIWLEIGVGGEIVKGLSWEDVEETGETLEENALLKATAVVAATGFSALADDTGLEVAALGGAPGVRSARYAGEHATYQDNTDRLLEEMDGRQDRSARFRTVPPWPGPAVGGWWPRVCWKAGSPGRPGARRDSDMTRCSQWATGPWPR